MCYNDHKPGLPKAGSAGLRNVRHMASVTTSDACESGWVNFALAVSIGQLAVVRV